MVLELYSFDQEIFDKAIKYMIDFTLILKQENIYQMKHSKELINTKVLASVILQIVGVLMALEVRFGMVKKKMSI